MVYAALVLTSAILIVAAMIDLRTREVPDWIPLAILVIALVIAFGGHEGAWIRFATGLLLGFSVPAVLFFLGGLGGGDVKLLAALGALLGPMGIVQAAVWMGLIGGFLAIVALARGTKEYAYVPAIAAGFLMQCFLPASVLVQ